MTSTRSKLTERIGHWLARRYATNAPIPPRFTRGDAYTVLLGVLCVPLILAGLPWPITALVVVSQAAYWFVTFMWWHTYRKVMRQREGRSS